MNIDDLSELEMKDVEYLKHGYTDFPVLVCDTETVQGKPYTIQFYNGRSGPDLFYVSQETIMDLFYDQVEKYFEPNLSVWFFFSQFDLPIIHYGLMNEFCRESFQVMLGLHNVRMVCAKTWFADCLYNQQRWFIRDAYQYFYCSLAKACQGLNILDGKMEKPNFLGERKPKNEKERRYFEQYAKQDVIALWGIVEWIKGLHRRYDVPLSVSLADLCGKIFRRYHFWEVDSIKLPKQQVTLAALQSYHGGKTECYVETPVVIKDVIEYDIRSAYPWAMTTMPNFFEYRIRSCGKILLDDVMEDGIYKVSGLVICPYRCLYSHDFKSVKQLHETWVTGYELVGAIKRAEFEGVIHEGYIIESERLYRNPLIRYVNHFFELKEQAEKNGNITERLWAKLALNALYGKFINRIDMSRYEREMLWRGGVLFHPLMATCVTGKLRGLVHDIEHDFSVIHTSTDSFITRQKDFDFRIREGLGSLRKEREGDILIVRRKMYVIFDHLELNCLHRFMRQDDAVICEKCQSKVLKAALHGFFLPSEALLAMWQNQKNCYVTQRMTKLNEARRSRDPELIPFMMRKYEKMLHVDWSKLRILT